VAKSIMIQGTMSNAGKSLLTAGLCRIFRQDGLSAAPFKSQNMALNSFITAEGLEMGRAQAMQAEAAGIAPLADMNPVLLKPTNDTGSQVIVCGEVLGNMSAREYFAYKKQLVPVIAGAYRRLAEAFDVIVIEGAGSPAEINLHENDIVNMGMAAIADAPVLLVGDIDRGGVFAQLVGTVELLTPGERSRVKGLIINKFRGDESLLTPGIDMLTGRTGIPTVGVVPYTRLEIDDEDSLSERFDRHQAAGLIDMAVIRLPRIANFTDFNAWEHREGVSLRYVSSVGELGSPDVIFLPGTKNTMDDLRWLRQCGLEAAILKAAAAGVLIFGICGGYQMLGETLSDPYGVETGGSLRGIGLLPMDTVFARQKTRTQVRGRIRPLAADLPLRELSGLATEGYEIHMGESVIKAPAVPLEELSIVSEHEKEPAGKTDGAVCGNIYGSYMHGIFDREEIPQAILAAVCRRKGLDPGQLVQRDPAAFREEQYDRLAAVLREHLDMERIYRILRKEE